MCHHHPPVPVSDLGAVHGFFRNVRKFSNTSLSSLTMFQFTILLMALSWHRIKKKIRGWGTLLYFLEGRERHSLAGVMPGRGNGRQACSSVFKTIGILRSFFGGCWFSFCKHPPPATIHGMPKQIQRHLRGLVHTPSSCWAVPGPGVSTAPGAGGEPFHPMSLAHLFPLAPAPADLSFRGRGTLLS